MSGFHLNINTMEGAAFADNPDEETLRIIQEVVIKIRKGFTSGACHDINGNRVGDWYYSPPEDEEDEEDGA